MNICITCAKNNYLFYGACVFWLVRIFNELFVRMIFYIKYISWINCLKEWKIRKSNLEGSESILGDSIPSPFFPPLSAHGDVQSLSSQPTSLPPNIASPQQPGPQHPGHPPPYPNPPPGTSPLPPMNHHHLLQQQLLQNPHFAAARDSTANSPPSGEYNLHVVIWSKFLWFGELCNIYYVATYLT